MNALVGQKAKANCSLLWLTRNEGANDGCRKDGRLLALKSGITSLIYH